MEIVQSQLTASIYVREGVGGGGGGGHALGVALRVNVLLVLSFRARIEKIHISRDGTQCISMYTQYMYMYSCTLYVGAVPTLTNTCKHTFFRSLLSLSFSVTIFS